MSTPAHGWSDFLFLRPLWLLALLALPLLWLWWRRRRAHAGVWQRHVDAHLLPHLLVDAGVSGRTPGAAIWLALAALVILAQAGPSWRQQAVPLWQQEAPLLIALDLSAAMRATDLPPSRLTQARAKLNALLSARKSGQVGLLAYAGEAFAVAPITRDARTVAALLDSLSPDLMPVEGQRADLAIAQAQEMLHATGASQGDILLVTDQVDARAAASAAGALKAGYRVSAIGVGTLAGAPLTGAQGFITGSDGQPLLARLDPASLTAMVSAGGGGFATLTVDDTDLQALGVLDPHGRVVHATDTQNPQNAAGVLRSDDGYWLLLLALPLALLALRQARLAVLPLALACAWPLLVPPVYAQVSAPAAVQPLAAPPAPAPAQSFWDALWLRADQRARQALDRGDTAAARALAPDPALQGAAAFRGADYAAAAQAWAQGDSSDASYNRGNALAKAGKLEDAVRAYDEALKREPGMADALANRKAVQDLLDQQKQQQQQQQKDQGDSSSQDQKDGSQQDQQKGSQQDQKDGSPQNSSEQSQSDAQKDAAQSGERKPSDATDGKAQSESEKQAQKDQAATDSAKAQQPPAQDGQSKDAQSPGEKPADASKDAAPPTQSAEQQQAQAARQQAAEEAARQQMQQALDQSEGKTADAADASAKVLTPEERAQLEKDQALQQWLRRVPDDPGGLLRRKFELEHRRRQAQTQQEDQR